MYVELDAADPSRFEDCSYKVLVALSKVRVRFLQTSRALARCSLILWCMQP